MNLFLFLVIVFLLFGSYPMYPFWGPTGAPYGYYPMGGLSLALFVLVLLALANRGGP